MNGWPEFDEIRGPLDPLSDKRIVQQCPACEAWQLDYPELWSEPTEVNALLSTHEHECVSPPF